MIGPAVFAKLSSLDLNLANPDGTQRIYPSYQTMIDKDYPAIVYMLENYQPDTTLDGATGTATIDLKLTAIALDYDDAAALATTVANALDGTLGTWGTVTVQGCFVTEVSESSFVDTDMQSILYYVHDLTLQVCFIVPS
jgi:hypothetical protein